VAECPPVPSATPRGVVAEALAAHRARYTMDAERKIHETMFGTDPAPVAVKDDTEETDLDALFF
jgi:hypothetical protein